MTEYRCIVLDRWSYLPVTAEWIERDLAVPRYLATGSGVVVVGVTEQDAREKHRRIWAERAVERN